MIDTANSLFVQLQGIRIQKKQKTWLQWVLRLLLLILMMQKSTESNEGAYGAFFVTFFWAHFSPEKERLKQKIWRKPQKKPA